MKPAPSLALMEKKLGPKFGSYFTRLSGGNSEVAEEMLRAHFDELREAERARPTPYENSSSYKVMMGLAERVEKAALTVLSKQHPIPLFGTLPIGELNAMAIKVPESDEYLIAFQQGVFGFANLLTKAVAASLPATTGEDGSLKFSTDLDLVEAKWEEDSEPLRRLDEFLAAYLIAGDPHAAEQYFLEPPFSLFSQMLLDAFELFIFGHELGHVVAGHLNSSPDQTQQLGPSKVERLSPSWEMEFEADYIGFALALQAMGEQKFDAALSYAGVDLFFSSIEIVTRALTTLVYGEARAVPASKSHPPPDLRREMLRQHLDQIGDDQAASARDLAATSEKLLELMWTRIAPNFVGSHERGLQPASIWR
jgi:hypothetical protein